MNGGRASGRHPRRRDERRHDRSHFRAPRRVACRTTTRPGRSGSPPPRDPGPAVIRRLAPRGHPCRSRSRRPRRSSWRSNRTARRSPSSFSSSWASRAPCSRRDRCSSRSQSSRASAPSRRSPCARSACHGGPWSGRWLASSASSAATGLVAGARGRNRGGAVLLAIGTRVHRPAAGPDARLRRCPCGSLWPWWVPRRCSSPVAVAVSIAIVNAASTPDKLRISQR